MQPDNDNHSDDVIEKMVQWHGLGSPPESHRIQLAPWLIPLAADKKTPPPVKLTGAKYVLQPGDTVTIAGDSDYDNDKREYVVAIRPLPHNQLHRTTKEEPPIKKYRSPTLTNNYAVATSVAPQGDPKTDAETSGQARGHGHENAAGASSSSPRGEDASQLVLPVVQNMQLIDLMTETATAATRPRWRRRQGLCRNEMAHLLKNFRLQWEEKSISPGNGNGGELSKAAQAKLETVPRESDECMQIVLQLIPAGVCVVSVSIVRNESLEIAFAVAISGVAGKHELITAFHGTTVESIDTIVREGFKEGVYLPTDAKAAVGYARKYKSKYLVLCELCVDEQCIIERGAYYQPDKALVRTLYVVEFR